MPRGVKFLKEVSGSDFDVRRKRIDAGLQEAVGKIDLRTLW
jgi:hypothetical protein